MTSITTVELSPEDILKLKLRHRKGLSHLEMSRLVFEKRKVIHDTIKRYHEREEVSADDHREIDTPTLRKLLNIQVGELHGHLEAMSNAGWIASRIHLRKIGDPKDGKPKRPCKVWKPTGVVPVYQEDTQGGGHMRVSEGALGIFLEWMKIPCPENLKVTGRHVYGERFFESMRKKHS